MSGHRAWFGRAALVAGVVVLAAANSGCSTVNAWTRTDSSKYDNTNYENKVYGGVRHFGGYMGRGPCGVGYSFALPVLAPFMLADLATSAAVDTALLPAALILEADRSNNRTGEKRKDRPPDCGLSNADSAGRATDRKQAVAVRDKPKKPAPSRSK